MPEEQAAVTEEVVVQESALNEEQQAVLAEAEIPVEDGRIAVADHAKLLSTLATLRSTVREMEKAQQAARLEAMPETERAVEAAREEGKALAMAEYRTAMARAQVTAAAAAAGFADPADASGFLHLSALESEDEVRAAVEELAKAKPYLLRKTAPPPIEQGPKGSGPARSGNDWLRGALGGAR